ncbi:hypothetical protein [Agrobacterium rosae]|uniref:Uncharacterized protein n=1 Tax=Agrobacterium rosae TaxID=1972867 RepID=A0AAW9FR51_9HYPH|nr:hypothetical protein [Agrobacterium rosae]MDX8305909.1 hypothetical protein [Agrobacterium rosae]
MTDLEPNKAGRTSVKGDFDTIKLAATNLEEKRISVNRDKTEKLKAARLQRIESE